MVGFLRHGHKYMPGVLPQYYRNKYQILNKMPGLKVGAWHITHMGLATASTSAQYMPVDASPGTEKRALPHAATM